MGVDPYLLLHSILLLLGGFADAWMMIEKNVDNKKPFRYVYSM